MKSVPALPLEPAVQTEPRDEQFHDLWAPPVDARPPGAHYAAHSGAGASHGAELRPFALIVEHGDLVHALDLLDAEVTSVRRNQAPDESWRAGLGELLHGFLANMSSHFDAESPATAAIFAEHADRKLVDAWEELDGQHSWLLRRFSAVAERVLEPSAAREEVLRELEEAMKSFRLHELRENLLFGAA